MQKSGAIPHPAKENNTENSSLIEVQALPIASDPNNNIKIEGEFDGSNGSKSSSAKSNQ